MSHITRAAGLSVALIAFTFPFSSFALTPAPSPTCSLSISKTVISPGQAALLSWTTTNATTLTIDQAIGAVQPVSAGSLTVKPIESQTYTATAKSASGASVTCKVAVAMAPSALVDELSTATSVSSDGRTAMYSIKIEVTAVDGDIYLSRTAGLQGSVGLLYEVEGTTFSGTTTSLMTGTALLSAGMYTIKEGETKQFTLTTNLSPLWSGLYGLNLDRVYYGTAPTKLFEHYVNANIATDKVAIKAPVPQPSANTRVQIVVPVAATVGSTTSISWRNMSGPTLATILTTYPSAVGELFARNTNASLGVGQTIAANMTKSQILAQKMDWKVGAKTNDGRAMPAGNYTIEFNVMVPDGAGGGATIAYGASTSTVALKTSAPLATYRGYLDGSLFIVTENSTEANALANCKLNEKNNPTHAIRCTWGTKEIYNSTPPTCGITASPTTVMVDDPFTLTWTSKNAVKASMNSGVGAVPVNGTRSLALGATSTTTATITLTVTSASNATATCSTKVLIVPLSGAVVTIDSTSLVSTSTTPVITGTAKGISGFYLSGSLQDKTHTYASENVTIKNGRWSVKLPPLVNGTYSVVAVGPGYVPVAKGTLVVKAASTTSAVAPKSRLASLLAGVGAVLSEIPGNLLAIFKK